MVKRGSGGETLYVNPWYVAALGRNSKHVFAGTTRIVTKMENFPTGEGYGTGAKNLTEVFQYFYHPDHLGSTSYATDKTGEVYQHLEYFPFGETWSDEVTNDRRVPYRFTGKEFDEEAKLYYFGARYYDPRTSVWQSTDPILGDYLAGKGKSNPLNFAFYTYAYNNPVILTDPDGNEPVKDQAGNVAAFMHLLNNSPSQVGKLTGQRAAAKLLQWGEFDYWNFEPKESWLNTQNPRYIYTKKSGWLDMQHFMFYAGVAYKSKLKGHGHGRAIYDAISQGYSQELYFDKLSRGGLSSFSYEDIPSDYVGAVFGAKHFDPTSSKTPAEQIGWFIRGNLKPTIRPQYAPNYRSIPKDNSASERAYNDYLSGRSPQDPISLNKSLVPMYAQP